MAGAWGRGLGVGTEEHEQRRRGRKKGLFMIWKLNFSSPSVVAGDLNYCEKTMALNDHDDDQDEDTKSPKDILEDIDEDNDGSPESYEPQQVGNIAFQQDMNYRAALSWQCDRETVVNARDAGATVVVLHPDWYSLKAQKETGTPADKLVYRWMVEDNGHGMDDNTLEHFADVCVSTKMVGLHGHFGMGAKLSILPGNHKGLAVISYQGGRGRMVVIRRYTTKNGVHYGTKRFPMSDGSYETVVSAPSIYDHYLGDKFGPPGTPRQQGTILVALGHTGTEDTWDAFPSVPTQNTFISKHQHKKVLNERFYSFGNMKVWAYELTRPHDGPNRPVTPDHNRTDEANLGQYRSVPGQKSVLNNMSTSRGVVPIPGHGEVLWFLFEEQDLLKFQDGQNGQNLASWGISSRRLSVLYNDELYSHCTDPAHFRYFGIFQNSKHFVLLFKPDITNENYGTDLLRREILYQSGRIPWSIIGSLFQQAMPPEITTFLNKKAPCPTDLVSLREETLIHLARKYRARLAPGARPPKGTTPRAKPSKPSNRKTPKDTRSTPRKTFVDFQFVDKTDEPQPRPAFYNDYRLTIYTQHPCFQDHMAYWQRRYENLPDPSIATPKIQALVLQAAATTLVLYVGQVLHLKGTPDYTRQDIDTMLSEEALAGVAYQLHTGILDDLILPVLQGHFGRPSED